MSPYPIFLRVLAASLAVILSLSGCLGSKPVHQERDKGAASKSSESAIRVTPIRPERRTLIRRTEQPGQIEAFEQTRIYSKATGFVKRFLVDIGDRIKGPTFDDEGRLASPGQVIAELSIPELEAELRQKQALAVQAAAEVKQAVAAIAVAEAASASAEAKLVESQAGVERDQAQYNRWKSEFGRIADLADKGAVTRKLQDETENQLRAADSSRRETLAKVTSAEAVVVESRANIQKAKADRDAFEARLQVAVADEQRVQALWSYATIRAPYDGIVAARNIDTGDLVQTGASNGSQPLFVVVRTETVRIFVDIPETDAVMTHNNSEALIRIPAIAGENFKGTITRSAWVLDTGTHTLRVEIDIENSDGRLRPGMYAYADVKVAEHPDVLVLPKTAVLKHDNQAFCLTIDTSGKVTRTPIVTGIQSGADVEIRSGLQGGEAVIGTNATAFKEGQQVELAEKSAAK